MMFRVWCKFEPEFFNPATGRTGQWRVKICLEGGVPELGIWMVGEKLCIPSTKKYPIGSIIRPHKELNRVFEARRGDR